eukprot:1471604-Rhodomonas_salina.5
MAESTAPPSDAGQARKMPKAGPFSYVWVFFGIVHVSVLFTSIFFNCNVIPYFIVSLRLFLSACPQNLVSCVQHGIECGISGTDIADRKQVIPTVSFFFIAPLSFTLHQRIITFMGAMAHSGVFFW